MARLEREREKKRINTVSSRSGPIKNLKKDTGTGCGGWGKLTEEERGRSNKGAIASMRVFFISFS